MNSWEVIAKAINEPGLKITASDWDDDEYIYYDIKAAWTNQGTDNVDPFFPNLEMELYKEPKKLVEWYRPRVVWFHCHKMPWHYSSAKFYREKDMRLWIDSKCKVVEWETIMAPETYEECND